METTVNKWGNSLAIRIPSKLSKGFSDGTKIIMERKGDSIIMHPEVVRTPSIDKLIKMISKDNLNVESVWSAERPFGKELI